MISLLKHSIQGTHQPAKMFGAISLTNSLFSSKTSFLPQKGHKKAHEKNLSCFYPIFTSLYAQGVLSQFDLHRCMSTWLSSNDLAQHIKEEEEHDLVVLEKALQESESQSLVTQFNRTKKFIPSRSHPSAPNKPPFETVIGLMTAPKVHIADLIRRFLEDANSEMPPWAHSSLFHMCQYNNCLLYRLLCSLILIKTVIILLCHPK